MDFFDKVASVSTDGGKDLDVALLELSARL